MYPEFSIPENQPFNVPFGRVFATDLDNLQDIIYSSSGSTQFLANPINGDIVRASSSTPLDFETL